MKLILLIGLACLPLMPSFADETEGKRGVEEVVSRALAANPMNAPPVSCSDAAPAYGGS